VLVRASDFGVDAISSVGSFIFVYLFTAENAEVAKLTFQKILLSVLCELCGMHTT
jgi:hypothetical protein